MNPFQSRLLRSFKVETRFHVSESVIEAGSDGVINALFAPRNSEALYIFFQFCVEEFSSENFFAMLALNDMKDNLTRSKAEMFMSQFVAETSPYEVNVPTLARKGWTDIGVAGLPDAAIITETRGQILTNLLDTFSRFRAPDKNGAMRMRRLSSTEYGLRPYKNLKNTAKPSDHAGIIQTLIESSIHVPAEIRRAAGKNYGAQI